jgi:peptidyl-prolyl cis-trans isomerase-like protein 2
MPNAYPVARACSFITFRSCKHLDKKHTIFGRVVGGLDTLTEMERVKTDDDDVPREDIVINKVTVFVNPFAEVDAQKAEEDKARREAQVREKAQAAAAKPASAAEIKPVKAGVGKYIGAAPAPGPAPHDKDKRALPDDTHDIPEPKRKKPPLAGFGDFSSW